MDPRNFPSWQITKHNSKWMFEVDFIVSIGQDEQRSCPMNAAGKIFDEIERRLIRPVNIFDDENDGALGEDIQDSGEDRRALRLAVEERAEWRCSLLGNVVEWT
jgi:hypothetical protein